MNGAMNADLVRDYAAPAVEDLNPEGDVIRQDDPASINICAEALSTANDNFHHEVQCPKLFDVWPKMSGGENQLENKYVKLWPS